MHHREALSNLTQTVRCLLGQCPSTRFEPSRTGPAKHAVRSGPLARGAPELAGGGACVRVGPSARGLIGSGWIVDVERQLPHVRNGLQDVARAGQQAKTGRQELHASSGATKERNAELILEAADLAAERWLRDVEAACGTPDVAFFGDCHEIAQLVETHPASIPRQAEPSVFTASYPNGIGAAGAHCGIVET